MFSHYLHSWVVRRPACGDSLDELCLAAWAFYVHKQDDQTSRHTNRNKEIRHGQTEAGSICAGT
ncbi:hypothetical protein E2C01_024957 [Portunus trituberculatus]|uniref:Uncharacterized protein n=1 Tax=Portunus trituberculatus TaxID=210409 RepID=A0A5B7EC35_PORTR|nr:hypothetical protein [Portunus trituberculatus]